MKVRIAFLKRGKDGQIQFDGAAFDVEILPRIGEMVVLPRELCEKIHAQYPPCRLAIKFEVVGIDHHWQDFGDRISVYISSITNAEWKPLDSNAQPAVP